MNFTKTVDKIIVLPGDGIGPEVIASAQACVDAAMELEFPNHSFIWEEALAWKKAMQLVGTSLPDETLRLIEQVGRAIKWPMETGIGGGIKSINVALRDTLGLYAGIRPIKYYPGVPSPLKDHIIQWTNYVIFRENTEDLYMGKEYEAGSVQAMSVIDLVNSFGGKQIDPALTGIGIKPISKSGTERITKAWIDYAIENGYDKITFMHKGNIMKHTEGAFMKRGTAFARNYIVWEIIAQDDREWFTIKLPNGRVIQVNTLIADDNLQQVTLNPKQFGVIITMNLNGDLISDASIATVGWLGIGGGINVNPEKGTLLAESIHGTADWIAGQNKANAYSAIISAGLLAKFMGYNGVLERIEASIVQQQMEGKVTGDLMRLLTDEEKAKRTLMSTTEQRDDLIRIMKKL